MEAALAEYLIHAPVFVRTVPGMITHWTTGATELYGYGWEEAQGRISHELLRTVFPEPLADIDHALVDQGHWQGLLTHTKSDGSTIWTESVWRLRQAADGRDARVVEINTDVTHRQLLARELDHRVKNTLAVVQGIARGSFRKTDRGDVQRFERRLIALSRAHDLLVRSAWSTASLGEVLGGTLQALGIEDRVEARGPDVALAAKSVVAYGLAFHELATNALKHGSLSNDVGRVLVDWELVGSKHDLIHLTWRELDGPPVSSPKQADFGSTLIKRALFAELGEQIDLRFEPDGLVCEFDGLVQNSSGL